ncbi:MAG: sulfite exporter TauE/SafE family protein [Geminicoccaceae bacterium]
MDIYLPIAELSVNLFVLLALGGVIGFLSGLFGVGGGFLMTPLLIFLGVPPAVAVGSGATQILSTSVSGVLNHASRRGVDRRMGMVLTAGGVIGSILGVLLFTWLRRLGQIDLVVQLAYVLLLGAVGSLMLGEGLVAFVRRRRPTARRGRLHQHYWLHGLPLKMRFVESRLYISALLPLGLGAAVGVLTALMGVGGGFIMLPAMIYLIGMPTTVVVGTSLLQIGIVSAFTIFLQAYTNQTVDIVLGLLLIAGGVVGAQFGARAGARLRGEQMRILLAVLVLAVCGKLIWDLVATPVDPFSLAG